MTPSERLHDLAGGRNPALIRQLKSGFAVMADTQFLRGYSLLLAYPMVGQLLDLSGTDRSQFLLDMAQLGEAVRKCTGCIRVNFAIYGNLDPFLHAHVWPRYEDEPEDYRTSPPLSYPESIRNDVDAAFSLEVHGDLLGRLKAELDRP